jgi:hypothetical protein
VAKFTVRSKKAGGPVEKGVRLEIKTEAANPYKAYTDDFGNYRVIVPETGKWTITVWFREQPIKGDIQSYWTPVRFDWVLEKTGETYSLKRQ